MSRCTISQPTHRHPLDALFDDVRFALRTHPAPVHRLNVSQTADQLTITVVAPGLDPNLIQVSVDQDLLTISGKPSPDADSERATLRRERPARACQRSIRLPYAIDLEHTAAVYTDGMLTIRAPRRATTSANTIRVTTAA